MHLQSASGKPVEPLYQGRAGLEYVVIDGVKGYLNLRPVEEGSDQMGYYFSRRRRGLPKDIPAGTPIITAGSENYKNYIPILFIGTNQGYDSIEELIEQQNALIEHQSGNPKDGDQPRFLVIGLHINTAEMQAPMEQAMEQEYGRQYINLREYMVTEGLKDAGIPPTEEDLLRISYGMTPSSLMIEDELHFNGQGYVLIGNLLYNRAEELHYLDEVTAAFDNLLSCIQEKAEVETP